MQNKQNPKLNLARILLFYLAFWMVWYVVETLLHPSLSSSLGGWENEVCQTIIKLLLWSLPAVLCVRHYKDDVWLSWREMLTTKVKWRAYALILLAFIAYITIGALLKHGHISIHPDFSLASLTGVVLFVGITEEAVFRGFFLNALLKKTKPWYAVLITALLFLVIHFPIWIFKGVFLSTFLSGGFLIVAVLSVIFSWTFIKSKNIIVPIVLHMSWNMLVTLFFG